MGFLFDIQTYAHAMDFNYYLLARFSNGINGERSAFIWCWFGYTKGKRVEETLLEGFAMYKNWNGERRGSPRLYLDK